MYYSTFQNGIPKILSGLPKGLVCWRTVRRLGEDPEFDVWAAALMGCIVDAGTCAVPPLQT